MGSCGSNTLLSNLQGIFYKKDKDSGRCYLLPIATSSNDGQKIENFLSENDNITMQGEAETFDILPGEITDTSFIPRSVQNECDNGYRWLSRAQETGTYMSENYQDPT